MLNISDVKVVYGQVQALLGVGLYVDKGEIVSIIGANGAGKSSLMRCIMGDVKLAGGSIEYEGTDLRTLKTHQIVEKGIVYVPEGRQVFSTLSVRDNLEMGAFSRKYSTNQMNERYDMVYSLFPILKERRRQIAGSLSGGQQQMLALGRGLMSDPQLLMLDEPSLGLAPIIVDEVFDTIIRINREKGISIILVEQNAYMALNVSNRCYVLENGQIRTNGESGLLLNDPSIKAAYLGG